MRTALWFLVALNVVSTTVSLYVALGLSVLGPAVRDVLQVSAGIALLTAVGVAYALLRKTGENFEPRARQSTR